MRHLTLGDRSKRESSPRQRPWSDDRPARAWNGMRATVSPISGPGRRALHLRPQPERIPWIENTSGPGPCGRPGAWRLLRRLRCHCLHHLYASSSTRVPRRCLGELTAFSFTRTWEKADTSTARRWLAGADSRRFEVRPGRPHRGHSSSLAVSARRAAVVWAIDRHVLRPGRLPRNVDLLHSHRFPPLEAARLDRRQPSASLSNTDLTGATLTAADLVVLTFPRCSINKRGGLTAAKSTPVRAPAKRGSSPPSSGE